MDSAEFGLEAEAMAAQHLEVVRGWRLLASRVRFREGEIDLVMEQPNGLLAFVEVKARRSFTFGAAVESVTPQKVRRIRKAVAKWRVQSQDWREGELWLAAMELREGKMQIEMVPME